MKFNLTIKKESRKIKTDFIGPYMLPEWNVSSKLLVGNFKIDFQAWRSKGYFCSKFSFFYLFFFIHF